MVFGHPLWEYPGPFLSKFSTFPLALQCRMVRHSQWVQEQHEKYGSVVRIAPNHISVSDYMAVHEIYGHKTGFLKGPFYEDKFCWGCIVGIQNAYFYHPSSKSSQYCSTVEILCIINESDGS